jgi:hypothetical protein
MASLLICGCAGQAAPESHESSAMSTAAHLQNEGFASIDDSKVAEEAAPQIKMPQHIIREGELRFETADRAKTRQEILAFVDTHKGYLSDDSEHRSSHQMDQHVEQLMVIRVPPANFAGLLEDVSRGVQRFDIRNIQAIDVTEQFVDTEARLRARKETENRYRELLKQANTVEDVLKIEQQIDKLRTEIESTEGHLRLLQDRESFSTLRITFYEPRAATTDFSHRLFGNLAAGWRGLVEIVLALAAIWPLLLIGCLITFVLRKRIIRESLQAAART